MDDPYTPVDCGIHSELELAIMHHTRLHIRWDDDGQTRDASVIPVDTLTRDGKEYLLVTDDGQRLEIRMDKLIQFESES